MVSIVMMNYKKDLEAKHRLYKCNIDEHTSSYYFKVAKVSNLIGSFVALKTKSTINNVVKFP